MKTIKPIHTMLQKDSHREIYGFLLNILLVYYGARQAYLLESSEFTHLSDKHKIDKLLQIAKDQGLFVIKDILSLDEYPRYWITKEKMSAIPNSDEKIGKWLGMKDPGKEYYNYKKKRLSLSIIETTKNVNITTEILLGDKDDIENIEHAKQRIELFNEPMIQHNFPYRFKYVFDQDDGTIKRFQELKKKNIEYISENKQQYINDFNNALLINMEDTHPLIPLFEYCTQNPIVLDVYLSVYLYVYRIFNEDILKDDNLSSKLLKINQKLADQINIHSHGIYHTCSKRKKQRRAPKQRYTRKK